MFDDKDFLVMVSLLNQYKAAWMNEPSMSKVSDTKALLRKEVAEKCSTQVDEALAYFENQCFQIQSRWNRPTPGHAVD